MSVGDEKLPNMTSQSQIEVSHSPGLHTLHAAGICAFVQNSPVVRFACVCVCVCAQALHSALHTFDMIESVLVRIEELTEAKESA